MRAGVKCEMNKMQNAKLKKGVTLIELLVILSIIVIIVAIGVVEFMRMDDKAIRERALVAAKGLATGLKLYYQDNKENYPPTNSIMALAPYTNITHLRQYFEPSLAAIGAGGVSAPPLQGIQIYYFNNSGTYAGNEVCIYGAVKTLCGVGIEPRYFVMYCVDNNESNDWSKSANQPTCFKDTEGVWRACARGL